MQYMYRQIHKLLTVVLQVSYILYLQLGNNVNLQRFHTLFETF